MSFSIQHAHNEAFTHDGMRPYFEYRDLGIHKATKGAAVMHVIKSRAGTNATGEWHHHKWTCRWYMY